MILPGHSGCKVYINDEMGFVAKSTCGLFPPDRFLEQSIKQRDFFLDHVGSKEKYKTPYIYSTICHNEEMCIIMELIEGQDPIEFLEQATDTQAIWFFNACAGLIHDYLARATFEKIDRCIFINKFSKVLEQLDPNIAEELEAHWLMYFQPEENIVIPCGPCHGDLTLSNMIIRDEQIVLLDFMDTYLDGPMQDIVKLRQDTKHQWIINRYPRRIENIALKRLDAFDKYLCLEFPKMDKWHYKLHQFMNLARILPYATDENTVDWVFSQILELI